MKCQNDGKYFHGSLERAASHQHRPVKFGPGANTSLKSVPRLLESDCFWVFYCLCRCWEMSMRNLFAESICFGGLMGPAVLFSTEKGCRLFIACFDALVLVPNCILYVCDVSLSICAFCSSSSFKHHFPFLMPRRSIRSDLPVPSNPPSDGHLRGP